MDAGLGGGCFWGVAGGLAEGRWENVCFAPGESAFVREKKGVVPLAGTDRMNPWKLLLAFAPWVVFLLFSLGHSLFSLQMGVVSAAIVAVVMGVLGIHRGLILWSGLGFFAFAVATVVVSPHALVIHHMGVLASGFLLAMAVVSLLAGHPFTEAYAREHTPQELWTSPAFRRGCAVTTAIWAGVFLINTLLNVAKLSWPAGSVVIEVIGYMVLVTGVFVTDAYVKRARRRREASV